MNFRRYYQYLKLEKGFSPNTVEAYMRDVERFAEYAEAEGFDLLNPELEHFHHFSAMIMDLGCSVTTLARMLAAIHNFYTFLVLSDVAEFAYKCTDFYRPGDEGGLIWNDPEIGVKWPIAEDMELNLSDKDKKWGSLSETFHFDR